MKKLMTSILLGFTVWTVTAFMVSNSLTAQDLDLNNIAAVKEKAVIDIVVDVNARDQQLAETINSKIHDFLFYGVYDYVTSDVTDGIVFLKGWTHETWIADALVKKLSQIDGVKRIDNQIQRAFGSDDLARRAVRSIYTDAMFEKYFFGADPPIHVVVNNNTIILAGMVSSSVERDRAAYLVDFSTNALTVHNQIEVNK